MDIMHHMLYYDLVYYTHNIYNIISLNMQQNNVTVGRQIFKITAYSLKIIHYVYKLGHLLLARRPLSRVVV